MKVVCRCCCVPKWRCGQALTTLVPALKLRFQSFFNFYLLISSRKYFILLNHDCPFLSYTVSIWDSSIIKSQLLVNFTVLFRFGADQGSNCLSSHLSASAPKRPIADVLGHSTLYFRKLSILSKFPWKNESQVKYNAPVCAKKGIIKRSNTGWIEKKKQYKPMSSRRFNIIIMPTSTVAFLGRKNWPNVRKKKVL